MSGPSSTNNPHQVAINMTSVNGTTYNKIDRSLDNEGAETHIRPTRHSPVSDEGHINPNSRRRSRSRSNSSSRRSRRDLISAQNDATPLLETDLTPAKAPTVPRADPEMDDDDDEMDVPFAGPGVDDGFFPTTTANGHIPTTTNTPGIKPRLGENDPADEKRIDIPDGPQSDQTPNGGGDIPMVRRGSVPFPYAPGYPGLGGSGVQVITDENNQPRIIPDVNVYQQKKNLAQGMMDLALLSANANQLRYVLESFERHPYYYFSVVFISFSLILQVAVGIGLIINSRYNVKDQDDICKADKINNYTTIGIFLITIVNVFIASFGVADSPGRLPIRTG